MIPYVSGRPYTFYANEVPFYRFEQLEGQEYRAFPHIIAIWAKDSMALILRRKQQ